MQWKLWNFSTADWIFFFASSPGYEGTNKFIRNSPIMIFFQLDVCHLYTSQVEQISNVLSLFSSLLRYRMHFKTSSPIIPGRFTAENIGIFPFGNKHFFPFRFGLTPGVCQASQVVPDLDAPIHHLLCPPKLIKPVIGRCAHEERRVSFQILR